MRLLLDTQILVWMVNGDRRLRSEFREALVAPDTELSVSAVIAFEYTELLQRKRLPIDEAISELVDRFDLIVQALPARCWEVSADLPAIHRDPVDRMLVAHALVDDSVIMTADANIRRYPVSCV